MDERMALAELTVRARQQCVIENCSLNEISLLA